MTRMKLGLIFGLSSIFVFLFIASIATGLWGDTPAALMVTAILMMAYFFICQFFASRGNPHPFRKDWPMTLSLGAGAILVALGTALVEKREVFLTQGLGFLLVWFVGTLAGAAAASMVYRIRDRWIAWRVRRRIHGK